MSLEKYKEKRDFKRSPEPSGGEATSDGRLRFVVQKHKSSHLHYDLRLELAGVLKSWAIPKGPSTNPHEKRLAVMVEDHPLDYRTFEGVIPEGEYGAGSVMVWDEGYYCIPESCSPEEMEESISKALTKGHFAFILNGRKLHGRFVLAHMQRSKEENAWLFFKVADDDASDDDILKDDLSAASGRTMDEIAAEASTAGETWMPAKALEGVDLSDAPESPMPRDVKPMLATLVDEPFDREGWLFEVKWDGYRAIAEVRQGDVRLYSRNLQPFNDRFPSIMEALPKIGLEAILDGEVVIVDEKGVSQFQLLQNYLRTRSGTLVYYVFDLLYLEGHDLRKLPLLRRKDILHTVLPDLPTIKLSDHVMDQGESLFRAAREQGLEGIVAKKGDSPYRSGERTREWLKVRTQLRQEFVIGGWTEPRGSRTGFGALVLGVYDGDDLVYVGHAGSGLDEKSLVAIHSKLKALERPESPFKTKPKTNMPAHWVEPELVCEVEFSEWTGDGLLRKPVIVGLREDKPPREVIREKPTSPPENRPSPPPPLPQKGEGSGMRENSPRPSEGEGAGVRVSAEETKSEGRFARKPKGKKEKDMEIEIGGHKLRLTNLDKVFWPEDGYTKGDLIDYYREIAPFILPYLKDRPESLNRHPDGIDGESFYQKNVNSEQIPDWIPTVKIPSEGERGYVDYLLCQEDAALVFLANLACIELNPWNSRADQPDKPDFAIMDLDPEDISFGEVVKAAQAVHRILKSAGVQSCPKTSGATGLHIYIPLGAKYTYEQARDFTKIIAHLANQKLPETTSVERHPAKRQGKVYLDYLQNSRGQTLAAAYCVRPRPGATVSTPLKWEEVKAGLDPTKFTIRTIRKRLDKVGDLFTPVLGPGIDLAQALGRF